MPKKSNEIVIPLWIIIAVLVGVTFIVPNGAGGSIGGDFFGGIYGTLVPGSSTQPGGTTPPPAGGPYRGNVNFIINRVDMLAGGAATPTSDSYNLFHVEPVKGASPLALTVTGTTTEVGTADAGYVWLTMHAGTDFYIITDAFLKANSRVKTAYWSDYDGDGDDDYIVKVYVGDIGVTGSAQTPTCTLSLPLLDLDVTGLTDDSPADVASIGTSEVVTTVTWKLSGITASDGAFLTRLYFATNATRGGDDLRFEELTLSGGWVGSSGAPTYWGSPVNEDNGNYEAWYINPSDYLEYRNGIRIWRGPSDADTLYISVNIRCMFEASENHLVDLYADFVDPIGTVATVNDQVMLSA